LRERAQQPAEAGQQRSVASRHNCRLPRVGKVCCAAMSKRRVQRAQYAVDLVLVAVVHQRQAYHAVFRVDAEIGNQPVRVKVAVLGTDKRLERDRRRAVVIAGVSFTEQSQIGMMLDKIENWRRQFVLVLQYQLMDFVEARVAVLVAGAEMVAVQFIEVIQYPGAARNLRVLRTRGIEILGGVAAVEIMRPSGPGAGRTPCTG
jgi:hypothetical protein